VEDLLDFLTTIHADKATNSNKKQKKSTQDINTLNANNPTKSITSTWDTIERRQYKDRRKIKVNRGRWLDSRQQKDRRKNLVFYTQI